VPVGCGSGQVAYNPRYNRRLKIMAENPSTHTSMTKISVYYTAIYTRSTGYDIIQYETRLYKVQQINEEQNHEGDIKLAQRLWFLISMFCMIYKILLSRSLA
jgi:hypothetical protein